MRDIQTLLFKYNLKTVFNKWRMVWKPNFENQTNLKIANRCGALWSDLAELRETSVDKVSLTNEIRPAAPFAQHSSPACLMWVLTRMSFDSGDNWFWCKQKIRIRNPFGVTIFQTEEIWVTCVLWGSKEDSQSFRFFFYLKKNYS